MTEDQHLSIATFAATSRALTSSWYARIQHFTFLCQLKSGGNFCVKRRKLTVQALIRHDFHNKLIFKSKNK